MFEGHNTGVARILVVDNYDSFVFNLVQYLAQLGAEVTVKRNDEVTTADALEYDGVLLSPGPGTPEDAGSASTSSRSAPGKFRSSESASATRPLPLPMAPRSPEHLSYCTARRPRCITRRSA